MKNTLAKFILAFACLTIAVSPILCAEGRNANTAGRTSPVIDLNRDELEPAVISPAVVILRRQVAKLREELENERAAREKSQADMQKRIDSVVLMLQLNSKKTTTLETSYINLEASYKNLETSYKNHKHTYSRTPFSLIHKKGFGSISSDALIPFVSQDKIGHGGKAETDLPIQ